LAYSELSAFKPFKSVSVKIDTQKVSIEELKNKLLSYKPNSGWLLSSDKLIAVSSQNELSDAINQQFFLLEGELAQDKKSLQFVHLGAQQYSVVEHAEVDESTELSIQVQYQDQPFLGQETIAKTLTYRVYWQFSEDQGWKATSRRLIELQGAL